MYSYVVAKEEAGKGCGRNSSRAKAEELKGGTGNQ